eukprot:5981294-Prymnesium_polylepis.1
MDAAVSELTASATRVRFLRRRTPRGAVFSWRGAGVACGAPAASAAVRSRSARCCPAAARPR